jgi:hypothetical protein
LNSALPAATGLIFLGLSGGSVARKFISTFALVFFLSDANVFFNCTQMKKILREFDSLAFAQETKEPMGI